MPDIYDRSVEETVQRFRRASYNQPEWSDPSAGTWEGITSELGIGSAVSFVPRTEFHAPLQGLPDGQSSSTTVLGRRALFTGLGGLVVGASLGVGAAWLIPQGTDSPETPVRRAVLTPLEKEDEELGIAELRPKDVGYSLVVDVPDGADHPGGYVEAWLINVDGVRMVSVGVFVAGASASFDVSDALIDSGYLIVDLSNEEFDNEVHHSSDTIMRGELRT